MAGISVPVDFQGNFGELTSGLRDSLKGTNVAGKFGQRLTSDMKTVGGAAVSAFKGVFQAGLAVVGAGAAAGLGVALNKGLQRLTGIENAQAKLRGLGNSAEDVEQIMGNALASVKGTAYGLDEAATVAASAVAAGIKPGSQLEAVLKNVANSAAASGTTMEEMGAIFNRVATNGKASNQELQQLADRGINIYGELAEQLGVTNEEVFKLASDGKISFQQFSDAAKEASGTVADEMGKTVTGSFANLKASLGRIGAGVMGGVFSQMAPLIQNITAAMEPLEDAAKGVGEAIGQHFSRAVEVLGKAAETIKPLWDSLSGGAQAGIAIGGLAGAFLALSQSIAPLLGPVGRLLPTLAQLRPLLGVLTGPVGAVAAVITGLVLASDDLRAALTGIFDGGIAGVQKFAPIIQGQLGPAMEAFQSLLGTLWGALGKVGDALAPVVTSIANTLAPILGAVAANVLPTLTAAFGILEPAISIVGTVLQKVIQVGVVPLMDALSFLAPFVGGVLQVAFASLQTTLGIIGGAFKAVAALIQGDWQGALDAVVNAVESTPLGKIIRSLTEGIISFLSSAWSSIRDTVVGVWGAIVSFVTGSVSKVRSIVIGTVRAVQSFWSGAWNAVKNTVSAAWNAILSGVTGAVRKVQSVVTSTVRSVQSFWSGVWNKISGTTRAVWNTINSTITSAVNSARSTVTRVFNSIRSSVTSAVNSARSAVSGAFNSIRSVVGSAASSAASAAISSFNRLRGGISNAIGSALSVVRGLPGRLRSAVGNLGSLLYGAGRDLIMGLARGITNALGAAASAAARVAQSIRDKFPGSPVKDGPLVSWNNGGAGVRLAGMLADGLNQSTREVSRASVNLARSITTPFATASARSGSGGRVQHIDNSSSPTIQQNYYGPTTSGGRLREIDWTLRYATRARTYESAGMAVA